MPFLTYTEFKNRLNPRFADDLHTEGTSPFSSASFTASERDAAAEIRIRTGINAPPLASSAEDWCKFAAFALILWHRVGTLPNLSEQTYTWAKQIHDHVEELLSFKAQELGWQIGNSGGNDTFNRAPFARYNEAGAWEGGAEF